MSKIITENNEPLHIHDCDECIYLGSELVESSRYDLYFHKRDHGVEFIARFSSNGPAYICITSHTNDTHHTQTSIVIRICELLYLNWELKNG